MRSNMNLKRVAVTGALFAGLAGSVVFLTAPGAVASSSTPSIITTNFVCSNGMCAIGPGDVGMPFAAGLVGTGGPDYTGPECNPYIMTVISGKLPPGLQLGEPICEWEISGTPTKAGSYSFTVQIAPQPNNQGQQVGPDGTQQFTITVGTGNADRLVMTSAVWYSHHSGKPLRVTGFDVNYGATYTVYVTATGKEVGTITRRSPDNGGDDNFTANFPETTDLNNITVTDSLGGNLSIPVIVNTSY